MDYKLEIQKEKTTYKIIFILGFFLFPLWILNIGRKDRIKELEALSKLEK